MNESQPATAPKNISFFQSNQDECLSCSRCAMIRDVYGIPIMDQAREAFLRSVSSFVKAPASLSRGL